MRRPASEGDDGMSQKYSVQVNIVFTCQKCWVMEIFRIESLYMDVIYFSNYKLHKNITFQAANFKFDG
jgi:hypothetical protein